TAATERVVGEQPASPLPEHPRLPKIHWSIAGRVDGGEGSERPPAKRLVQRPQRLLPRLRQASGDPGERVQQVSAHGRRVCSLQHYGGDYDGGRQYQQQLRTILPGGSV